MKVVDVVRVLKLRQHAIKIAGSKLLNALGCVDQDQRLRDMLVYYAANTGRFGGRRVQVQNLPKGISGFDVPGWMAGARTYETLCEFCERAGCSPADGVTTLMRSCFVGKLAHCDYAAIECRCVAWLAGEEVLLEQFRVGRDPYIELARELYGCQDITKDQRWVAKQIVLGCCYGMGADKFELMCANMGVDIAEQGLTGDKCVQLYRSTFPKIAGTVTSVWNNMPVRRGGLWHKYQSAVNTCITEGGTIHESRCTFIKSGHDMSIYLPSGRPIVYRNIRMEDVIPRWGGEAKPTACFDHPRGYVSILFGGKITENISQGICRDLLCNALVKTEEAGLSPVMHTHDEIVCDGGELGQLAKIMVDNPTWADGFPLNVEGHVAPWYSKVPIQGFPTVKV